MGQRSPPIGASVKRVGSTWSALVGAERGASDEAREGEEPARRELDKQEAEFERKVMGM